MVVVLMCLTIVPLYGQDLCVLVIPLDHNDDDDDNNDDDDDDDENRLLLTLTLRNRLDGDVTLRSLAHSTLFVLQTQETR